MVRLKEAGLLLKGSHPAIPGEVVVMTLSPEIADRRSYENPTN